jgi:group I intron endonuclease
MRMKNACQRTPDLFIYAEDNRPSIVYLVVNVLTNDRYIGVTRVGLDKRRYMHFKNARRDDKRHGASKFYAAIRKYGEAAFSFAVLEDCPSYRDALKRERELIAETTPEYNLTLGGEGVFGHRHSAASKAKMSKAKRGKAPWKKGECPPEVRAKLSAMAKARKRPAPTEKAKARFLVLGKKGNEARRRGVICVTDGKTYRSVTEAAIAYGTTTASIGHWCAGRFQSRLGLKFSYVEAPDGN